MTCFPLLGELKSESSFSIAVAIGKGWEGGRGEENFCWTEMSN